MTPARNEEHVNEGLCLLSDPPATLSLSPGVPGGCGGCWGTREPRLWGLLIWGLTEPAAVPEQPLSPQGRPLPGDLAAAGPAWLLGRGWMLSTGARWGLLYPLAPGVRCQRSR